MDSGDACLFDRLPHAMRDNFLQQAFKQLDQRHQFGVVPLVCHLWQQLVPNSCSSLEVELRSTPDAAGMAAWLEQHKPELESISMTIKNRQVRDSIRCRLLGVEHSRSKLQTLKLHDPYRSHATYPLTSLTNLSSLHLIDVLRFGTTQLGSSVLQLTQLRRLNLEHMGFDMGAAATFVQGVARSLLHLTHLDFIECSSINAPNLLPLTALHDLEDLRLAKMWVKASDLAVLKQLPISEACITLRPGDVDVEEVGSWLKAGGGARVDSLFFRHYGGQLPLPEIELLMSHLCTSAPQLRSLSVLYMPKLGRSTGLAGVTQLTSLAVCSCGMDDAGLLRLSALTGLRELDLTGTWAITGAYGSFECLASSLQQLTMVEVRGSVVEEAVKQAFGPGVLRVPTLTSVRSRRRFSKS